MDVKETLALANEVKRVVNEPGQRPPRPVRAGDRLVSERHRSSFVVGRVVPPNDAREWMTSNTRPGFPAVLDPDGCSGIYLDPHLLEKYGWTHEDGAPIDVAETLARAVFKPVSLSEMLAKREPPMPGVYAEVVLGAGPPPRTRAVDCSRPDCVNTIYDAMKGRIATDVVGIFCSSACLQRTREDRRAVLAKNVSEVAVATGESEETIRSRIRDLIAPQPSSDYADALVHAMRSIARPPTRASLRRLLEENIPLAITVDDVVLDLVEVEPLARRLWEADPEVEKVVAAKADATLHKRSMGALRYEGRPLAIEETRSKNERLMWTRSVAWKIDEGGLRSKWIAHVRKALRRPEAP